MGSETRGREQAAAMVEPGCLARSSVLVYAPPAALPPPGSVVAAEDTKGCLSVDGE